MAEWIVAGKPAMPLLLDPNNRISFIMIIVMIQTILYLFVENKHRTSSASLMSPGNGIYTVARRSA
jgi:hypothetical protein